MPILFLLFARFTPLFASHYKGWREGMYSAMDAMLLGQAAVTASNLYAELAVLVIAANLLLSADVLAGSVVGHLSI